VTESQTAVRLPSEPLKFPLSVTSPARTPVTPFMESVSETGCLLLPLSMLPEACQVLFIF
jgi:hypothetical protein